MIPKLPDVVWRAIATSESLAGWMYPNNFEPKVGHRFTFEVPAKPEVGFEGLSIQCEVLVCDVATRLVFSWAAGHLKDTKVSFELQPEGIGTRLLFEHSGFDTSHPFGKQAFHGARHGWGTMLDKLNESL